MFTIIGADQKQYGPVTADEVRQWIRDGRADGRTLARSEAVGEWQPLASFPEFAAFTAAPGTPPRLPGAPAAFSPLTDAQLLAGTPDFDLGQCLGRAWELLMNNFGLLVAACTVVWMLEIIISAIPFAGAFLSGVFYGGLYLVFLKRIRGQETSVGETFAGFSTTFVQLLLAGFVSSFLTGLASLLCGLPGIYLKIAWIFCLPLVIDKRLEFWTAMELSRTVVTRVWFKLFGLALIAFAPTVLAKGFVFFKTETLMFAAMHTLLANGTPDITKMFSVMVDIAHATVKLSMLAQVVFLINLPFATGALMYAYEALFGPRTAPAA
ncbi:MAG: hypothetical protein JWQ04_366 [Pedosphaera sp.]|nr:hypothetical protein [Pedosphaera sp.]